MPSRGGTLGRKLCTSTSAVRTSAISAARSSAFFRSSTTPSLLRLTPMNARLSASSVEGYLRKLSPVGGSILMTSAPWSASSEQPYGPAM
jgi:hypothetical protein